MELIAKTERTTTTIVGTIQGVNVNINYERKAGEQPQNMNANCNLPSTVEGAQPIYINVTRQAAGQTSVTLNGNKDIADVAVLIEEIKAELEIIAMEGVTV